MDAVGESSWSKGLRESPRPSTRPFAFRVLGRSPGSPVCLGCPPFFHHTHCPLFPAPGRGTSVQTTAWSETQQSSSTCLSLRPPTDEWILRGAYLHNRPSMQLAPLPVSPAAMRFRALLPLPALLQPPAWSPGFARPLPPRARHRAANMCAVRTLGHVPASSSPAASHPRYINLPLHVALQCRGRADPEGADPDWVVPPGAH